MRYWFAPVAVCALFSSSGALARCVGPDTSPNSHHVSLEIYRDCMEREARIIRDDPGWALEQRAYDNSWGRLMINLARGPMSSVGLEDYTSDLEDYIQSERYTTEFRDALSDRMQSWRAHFDTARSEPDWRSVIIKKWGEFSDELVALRDNPATLPEEKNQIDEMLREGDYFTKEAVLISVYENRGLTKAEVTAIVRDELKMQTADLKSWIRTALDRITKEGQSSTGTRQIGETQQSIRNIAAYNQFGQAIVGVAAQLGVFNARDARTISQGMQGAAQLSSGLLIAQTAQGAQIAGGYGMAIAGATMIAGALSKQGPSEGEMILESIKALAKQIEHLQFTVENGFADLSTQISQSERRVLAALNDVLDQGAVTQNKIDVLNQEVADMRAESLAMRYNQHASMAAGLDQLIVYYDDACLRRFRFYQKGRGLCAKAYTDLTTRFLTDYNRALIGQTDPELAARLGFEDRTYALIKGLSSYEGVEETGAIYHRPTLDLLWDRVQLFQAYNPGALGDNQFRNAFDKLAAADDLNKALFASLQDDALLAELKRDYREELEKTIARMQQRRRNYHVVQSATAADRYFQRELNAANLPSSLFRQAEAWRPGNGKMVFERLVGEGTDLARIDTSLAANILPHDSIYNRMRNFSAVALAATPARSAVFPDALIGNTWILPANLESGNPEFPISKSFIAKALSPRVASLLSVNGDNTNDSNLDIRYSFVTVRPESPVAPFNTREGNQVVIDRMLAQGYDSDPENCGVDVNWKEYFQATYSFPEYSMNRWEHCHGDHLHHELKSATKQAMEVTVTVTLTVPTVQSPQFTTSATIPFPASGLDSCFLAFDRNRGTDNKWAMLLAFKQEYPSPITGSCTSLETAVAEALLNMGDRVRAHLARETVTTGLEPHTITYGNAIADRVTNLSEMHLTAFVDTVMPSKSDLAALDRLAEIISALEYFRDASKLAPPAADEQIPAMAALDALAATTIQPPAKGVMSGKEIREYLLINLPDPDHNQLRDLDIIRATADVVAQLDDAVLQAGP